MATPTSRADELARLRAAAGALEGQRPTLGDDVVEAGLTPLRERIAALEAPIVEERKLVTTLFADLVGFTSMSEDMDAEDVRAVMSRYFARWAAAIEARGGIVEKFIGDAVVAVFGMRQASEDDPERAIHAALDMARSLIVLNEELAAEDRPHIDMRVGINTGEVVVGAVGDRQQEEWVAVGSPMNVASRLQAAAPVGGILIAHSTFRHVRGVFDVREIEPLDLKGVSESIRAYVVLRAKPLAFRSSARGVEGVDTAMVGRAAELTRLQGCYHSAADGEPGIVTVVADAGMGKTRLLDEFANWLDLLPDEIVYIKGRARQDAERDAFSLIRDTIAFRFGILDTDPPALVRDKLAAGFGEDRRALSELGLGSARSALVGHLLGFDLGHDVIPGDLDAQTSREAGTQAFVEWVRELGAASPVVVVLDDIHWADDPSLDLAFRLIDTPDPVPILVICGARPALFDHRPAWQAGEPRHSRIDLLPLTTRESRQLVDEILHKVPDPPEDLRETIVAAAEGNPFHLEELVKMLIEDGVIVKRTDNWEIANDRLSTVRVPDTLVGVLQARIDALGTDEKSVLHRAAVIGRSFWDSAIEALGDVDGAGRVGESLDQLRIRELVYGRETSSIAGAAEFIFKHAVLREVAYQSVLRRYRVAYHARAAAWLASVAAATDRADEFAALIAGHHEAAGEAEDAAAWYLRAGRAAAARYANAEALGLLARATELASVDDAELRFQIAAAEQALHDITGDRIAESRDLDMMAALADRLADESKRIEVELRRADQATDVGKPVDAGEHATRAAAMARRIGDTELEVRGLLALGTSLWHQGSPADAVPVLTRAVDLAVAGDHNELANRSRYSRGVAQNILGRYDEADDDYRRSLEYWKAAGSRSGLSRVLNSIGILAYDRGAYASARAYLEEALAIKRAIGDRLGENRALNNLALVALAQHDFDAVVDLFGLIVEQAGQIHDLEGQAAAHQGLGYAALRTGRLDDAERILGESLRLFREERDQQGESQVLELLAQTAAARGDAERAEALAREALATTSAAELLAETAASHELLAHLAFEAGLLDEAAASYTRAVELHAELGNEGRVVQSRAGYAEALQALGRPGEARDLVDQVLARFREHGSDGIDQPVAALLAARRVLEAQGDAAVAEATELARRYVETTAAAIADPEVRRSFVENVAAHRIVMSDAVGPAAPQV